MKALALFFVLFLCVASAFAASLNLDAYRPAGNTNEDLVRACMTDCYSRLTSPGWELKACVAKCQELAQP